MQQTLFGHVEEPSGPSDDNTLRGPFAGVALENSLDKVLDYAIPAALVESIKVGQRVRVPLGKGNRAQFGYVVSIHPTTTYPKIKKLFGVDDERVLVGPPLLELARWMSRYYCAPLGAVLEAVIPSAVKKKVGVGYQWMVRLARGRDEIQATLEKTKAPKRRAILARLLTVEEDHAIELSRLASEAGATIATVRKLVALGLITITPEPDLPRLTEEVQIGPGDEPEIQLNEDQQKVYDDIRPRLTSGQFSVNLLLGVTGSGKTEVYLQCIRDVVAARRQAIVLVPEIALTPQTVRRFTRRFKRVAVLHSGLTQTQRHRYWQQIAMGQADVVVGARSAIFAPLPNLGIIVVDEEHEPSYKQDTIPRYHGRDVAVKRAQIENIPVLLGSATPSLETYYRVTGLRLPAATPGAGALAAPPDSQDRPYHLLTLPKRVRGLEMPHVELVDMSQERRLRPGVHLLSARLEHLLRVTLESGHQAILLLNRRGYSNFVYCVSCQNAMPCRYCDTTLTYHRSAGQFVGSARHDMGVHTGQLHCHYCLAVSPLPDKCPDCGKKLSLFGLGTQRVEEELKKKFPDLSFVRVDSDSMHSARDYEATLSAFAAGKIQVLLGTQMIAKGLDYPNVTLVGVISGDTALALPDFRSAERTFQLITQVAGRAGRGESPGRVVLQTFLPHDPTIRAALRHDYVGFAQSELRHRRDVGLPPFARMVRIVLRDQDMDKLHRRCEELAAVLQEAINEEGNGVKLKGPMPCAISRIAGYHRHQIVMSCTSAEMLQRVLANVRARKGLAKNDRIAVDVDPVSLL